MRIERLDLVRYGRFTDHAIAFGPRRAGQPDLHVVYGPNEAGKSTALDAFVSLLYGIATRTTYAFRHPRPSMSVAARLEIGGKVDEYVRFPAQPTLRDATGAVVPEGVFAAALSGLDRAAYKAMFSLDEETLIAGGEDILKSKGELGGMLFSASAGLAGFTETLAKLEEEADLLYKPSGRTHKLRQLENELAALKAREVGSEATAKTYRAAREKADRAEAELDAAKAERTRLDRRAAEITKLLIALPRLARIDRLLADRAPIAGLAAPPDGWLGRVDDIALAFARLEADRAAKRAALGRIDEERGATVAEAGLMAAASAVDRLASFRPRQVTAEEDIPKRLLQRDEALARLTEAVRALGRPDAVTPEAARGLILSRGSMGELSDLASRRAGQLEKAFAAEDALGATRERLAKARAVLEALPSATAGDALSEVVSRLRKSKTLIEIDQFRREAARLDQEIMDALAGLQMVVGLVGGGLDDAIDWLKALALPDRASVERWAEAEAALDGEATQLRQRAGDLDERLTVARARASRAMAEADLVDDAAHARLAAAMDAAWARHRATFDDAGPAALRLTADAYEAARAARAIAEAARARAADQVAARRAAADELATLTASHDALTRRRSELDQERAAARARVMAAVGGDAASGIERANDLLALIDRRTAVMSKLPARRDTAFTIARLEALAAVDEAALRDALARSGGAVDPAARFADLMDRAVNRAERAAKDAGAREAAARAVEDALSEIERRQRAAEAARAEVDAWKAAWDDALAATWLKGDPAGRSPAAVREVLNGLGDVREALQSIDQYSVQIDAMRRDQASYLGLIADAAALAGRPINEALPVADRVALGDRLIADLERQRGAERRAQALEAERAAALDALHAVEASIARLAAERDAMLAHYDAADLAALKAALLDAKRAGDLSLEVEREADALMAGLGVGSLEAARAALLDVDELALADERAALVEARAVADERAHHAATAHAEARAELDAIPDGEAALRLAEDRKALLLEIQATAERYLKLRLGIQATQGALRAYRDRHRSAMLTDAAARFRAITEGGFTDLKTQATAQGEVLIALQAGGASLTADAMSKGTRDQLYLALRMAGYVEWARTREALPFIADDIMETFDDGRARATFAMLADVACHGQVIYLTHHAHLVAIAREVCGQDVTVHELTRAG